MANEPKDPATIDRVALGLMNAARAAFKLPPFAKLTDAQAHVPPKWRAEAEAILYPPPAISDRERAIRTRAAEALNKRAYTSSTQEVLEKGDKSFSPVAQMAYELASEIEPPVSKVLLAREAYAAALRHVGCPASAERASAGGEDHSSNFRAILKKIGG